jgi:hypothetical protein
MKRFKEYLNEWAPYPGAADNIKSYFQAVNTVLPEITKQSKIIKLDKNRNPIIMHLADQTQLFFTIDQYKRIKGVPEIGKVARIAFQRNEGDSSQSPSKINYIEIL